MGATKKKKGGFSFGRQIYGKNDVRVKKDPKAVTKAIFKAHRLVLLKRRHQILLKRKAEEERLADGDTGVYDELNFD